MAALELRCEQMERRVARQSDEIKELHERLAAMEGQQRKTHTQVVSFQVKQQERALNPTERKQIAELVGERVLAAQKQFLPTVYFSVMQSNSSTRREEPLYGP